MIKIKQTRLIKCYYFIYKKYQMFDFYINSLQIIINDKYYKIVFIIIILDKT